MSNRLLLRNGCVLTLGARTPNLETGDVFVEDGRIAEVGRGLRARDAEVVDATDTIVMPGFIDTHRHTWHALFRNLDVASGGQDASPAERYGPHCRPDDVYAATLLGLSSAVETGITTVVDWADVGVADEVTEALVQAHTDAGLRTVLVHAAPAWADAGQDAGAALRRLVADKGPAVGPATTLAAGLPTPRPGDADRVAEQWGLARELGLRIHTHVGADHGTRGVVAELGRHGLLGDDVTLVHSTHLGDDDLDAIASHDVAVSLTPSSEMVLGLGQPPIQKFIDRDIRPGLGVDDEQLAPLDLFAQMRMAQAVQHAGVFELKLAGKAGVPSLQSTREVIRSATVDGAKVAGLGATTGSLEPGRQADIVMLRTDRPNIAPVNDPIGAVVWGMDPSNVDAVFVGGRALMRDGALDADIERVRRLALAARDRVGTAAGDPVQSTPGGTR